MHNTQPPTTAVHDEARAQETLALERRRRADQRGYLPYLIPGLLGLIFVILIPMAANFGLSFTSWDGVGTPKLIGFDNYLRLVTDSLFWRSFGNSIAFVFAMAIVPTALGLLLSALLFDYIAPRFGARISSTFRALYYLPQILPVVIAGVLWQWLLRPQNGVVNDTLRALGLDALTRNWLGDEHLALYVLMAILVWIQLGYTIVVFMAGMSRMDPSLHEAAQIDGATWLQRFRVITVNQLRPEIAVILVTTTVAALKVFGPVYVLTQGGPNNATMVPSYLSFYQFFTRADVGYGAAVATVLAALLTVLAIVMLNVQRRSQEEM